MSSLLAYLEAVVLYQGFMYKVHCIIGKWYESGRHKRICTYYSERRGVA
jgi:hypothetical protein